MKLWPFLFLFSFCSGAQAYEWMSSPMKGWEEDEVVLHLNPEQCPAKSTLPEAINKSISLWNSVSNSRIRMRLGENTNKTGLSNEPIIECSDSFGSGNTVGNTSISTDNKGNIMAARVLLNNRPGSSGNLEMQKASTMELALAHEFGHVLGLGHSNQEQALMFFNISNKQELGLQADDISGLLSIYGRDKKKKGFLGCGTLSNPDDANFTNNQNALWSFLPLLLFMAATFAAARIKPISTGPNLLTSNHDPKNCIFG